MKKTRIFVSAVLFFAVLFGICTSGAPFDDQTNPLGLVCQNGVLRATENGVSFSITAKNAQVSYPFVDEDIFPGANSLSLILSNYSLCKEIALEIVYKNGDIKNSSIAVEQYSTLKAYSVSLDNCDLLDSVTMSFGNVSSGEIMIYSVCAVSLFSENIDAIGEISACTYSGGTVAIKGTLQHSSVIEHSDSKLSVYSLSANETVEDVLSGNKEPVMRGGALSIRFEFSIPVDSVSERLKRYVVAVEDGENVHLIDAPIYPEVDAQEKKFDFKGVSSSVLSATVDTGVGLSVVDVEMSSLLSSGNNGYYHTVDGVKYFFDTNYIKQLDERIRILGNSSVQVLLRLDGLNVAFEPQEQSRIYAVVHFLCTRYSSPASGKIFGIVMGRELNLSIPEDKTLAQYAKASYDTLYAVLAAADDAKNPMSAVFSVSEDWGNRPQKNAVSADIFMEALFSVCGYYSETRFSIMTEAKKNPYGIDDDYIRQLGNSEHTGKKLVKSGADCHYVSSDNIARFYRGYEDLCHKYFDEMPQVIYSWTPAENTTQTALSAAYVYNYYKLFFARYISSFIISLPGDDAAQASALNDIKYKMKYIDTSKSLEVGDFARSIFGIEDWNDEIVSFKAENLEKRNVRDNLKLDTVAPDNIIGTYEYWNFSEHSSYSGWHAGLGCSSLSVESNDQKGRALCARLSPKLQAGGEYSFISYVYEEEENFRYNDFLLVELSFEGVKNREFEISIVLGGNGFLYEYRSVSVTAGKRHTFSLDISELTEKNPIEYVKICSKDLGENASDYKMCVYSVSAASSTYESDELRSLILAERERIHGDGQGAADEGPKLVWIVVMISAFAVTVAVMIMISRTKKNTRPEDRVSE